LHTTAVLEREITATKQRSAQRPRSGHSTTVLTLEEEIFSLHSFAPEILAQLPRLFAESVVDASSKVVGDATGEALVRCIGDDRLRDPEQVYASLDSFLQGGSDEMRRAIVQSFSARVHRLYRITMELAARPARIQ
jgi:hypothetical protein